ncbi:MAG TPA: hypothetical protein VKN18_17075, partial [Blastocatellia bacterium]|nr:hypothetical protein [Blastocatellia bacterium]
DPVTSPLIHKDSGRRARADPGEPNPFHKLIDGWQRSNGYAKMGHLNPEGIPLARIDRGGTMDPVTSPLIHKDSGRRARADPGEPNPFRKLIDGSERTNSYAKMR